MLNIYMYEDRCSTWSGQRDGYYISEQHRAEDECYDFTEALLVALQWLVYSTNQLRCVVITKFLLLLCYIYYILYDIIYLIMIVIRRRRCAKQLRTATVSRRSPMSAQVHVNIYIIRIMRIMHIILIHTITHRAVPGHPRLHCDAHPLP